MKLRILTLILLFGFLFSHCADGKYKTLEAIGEYKLEIPEPSGLALSADGKSLWTVSDENSGVYLISLDGKIIKHFTVNAEDLEGIGVVDDTTIAVIAERTREIILLTNDGDELFRKKLLDDSNDNNGLEGITYNKINGHYFIVKEKHPKLLLEYDNQLNEINQTKINFADDLSGLCYVPESDDLWIISDESKMVARCDSTGNVVESFKVNIIQIEGIAVDNLSRKIYLVSDIGQSLYIFEMK